MLLASFVSLVPTSLAWAANPGDADPTKSHLAAASAAYTLGHFAEAYDDYADLLKNYGDKLKKTDRTLVEARLKELATKTGTIAIHVNENQSTVTLDEKNLGTPAPAIVRSDVGPHHIHVEKDGFSPFDSTVTVTAAGRAAVEVGPGLIAEDLAPALPQAFAAAGQQERC